MFLEHFKVVCLPVLALGMMHYWDGAHLAPGADITSLVHLAACKSRGDTWGHTSPHTPSSQRDEGHQGKRHTCSTPTSKAPNWGMCSLYTLLHELKVRRQEIFSETLQSISSCCAAENSSLSATGFIFLTNSSLCCVALSSYCCAGLFTYYCVVPYVQWQNEWKFDDALQQYSIF